MKLTTRGGRGYARSMPVWKGGGRSRVSAPAASLAAFVAAGLLARPVQAQRGADYSQHEELSAAPSPNTGFPGLFDTELAREGAFVADLPALGIYYGVTPDLTLGTNLWSLLPNASGNFGGAIHGRYRLHSATWFRTTVDALVVRIVPSEGNVQLGLFGSNTEFVLGPSHRLSAHAWLGQLDVSDGEDISANGLATLVGASYSLVAADWVAFHVTALYLGSVQLGIDRESLSVGIDATGAVDPIDRLVYRGKASFRGGRWLFELGAFGGPSFGPFPWLNVAFELGG